MSNSKNIEILQSDWKDTQQVPEVKTPFVLHAVRWGFQTIGRVFPKAAGKKAFQLFATPRKRARHRRSDVVLEKARLFDFMYGKLILKGYEWGDGKKTVLLAHGWESRGTGLRSFVPSLVTAGYRVVAFDAPAHGDSDGKRTNLPHFAGSVAAIINHIGGVDGIIAHSFGGASSIYALREITPDTSVHKMVLIGVPADLMEEVDKAVDFLQVPKKAAGYFHQMVRSKLDPVPREEANLFTRTEEVAIEKMLIVHDREDRSVPLSNAYRIHEAWKQSTLLITEGYGHFRLMKNPDVIERIMAFIESENQS